MSLNHEVAFAEEAQEEVLATHVEVDSEAGGPSSKKKSARAVVIEADDSNSETSPLINSKDNVRRRQAYHRAGASYQRAIDEPWHGAYRKQHLPWYKKPSIFWLLPAFFPFCLAFGGLIVPKTYLILDLLCKDYLSDRAAKDPLFKFVPILIGEENEQCRIPEVQTLVSYFNTYQDLLSGIFSAILAPYYGSLSDRVGRKRIIVCASFGSLVTEVITIIVGRNPDTVSVYWLLLGALVDGLCGSFTAGLALSFAYASDCSPPEKRAVAFGYFHGTLFAGIALGPLVAGYLIKLTGGIMVVFYFALGCHVFFILFTTFCVPESLSEERQIAAREKYIETKIELQDKPWTTRYNFFAPLWVLRPTGPGSSPALRRNLFSLAAIDTMMFGVAMGTMRIILLYAQFKFGWDPIDASVFLTACNVVRVTGLLALLPLLTRIFRGKSSDHSSGHRGSDRLDINIIKFAIAFEFVGYLGYALTNVGAIMILSGVVAAVGGIGSPTLQSSMTKHIPAHMTGQVLGATGLLHALARVAGPIVFNLIYARTVRFYSGFVFLCLASVFVIVFVFSWLVKPNVYLQEESKVSAHQEQRQERDEAQLS